jgi:fungalysin metallopeptidase (M36)
MKIGKVRTQGRYEGCRLTQFLHEPGQYFGTPKEIWGFGMASSSRPPRLGALDVLRANADLLGLEGVTLKHRRTRETPAGWHVIFSQEHLGRYVERGYVSVHMDRQCRPFLIRNRAVPKALLPGAAVPVSSSEARQAAHRALRSDPGATSVEALDKVWFPKGRRVLQAYKLRVDAQAPRGDWIVFIDAATGRVIRKYNNLSVASGPASVFDPNPVVALGRWTDLMKGRKPLPLPSAAYSRATLEEVPGSGVLKGPRVHVTSDRVRHRPLDFRFSSDQAGFEEVMAYHHIDAAIRYIESLGYRGSRAIFRDRLRPLRVNARTRQIGSSYSSGTKLIELGRVKGIEDAEDGETILHEFAHAVQDAICPFFGQSHEAAAMGEGFGDYFAGSFFLARKRGKARKALVPTVMSWNAIGRNKHTRSTPPALRRLDSAKTFRAFAAKNGEHQNGTIWSATLWEILQKLGRKVADRIIIESHFQLDMNTTFARGARAILDADVNLYRGRHVRVLKSIFRRRAIGPLD